MGDDLSSGIAMRGEPEVTQFRDFALARGERAEATIFDGSGARAGRHWAAMANAMAMTTAEMDGGYNHAPCHAGLYTLPALLAEAEAADLDMHTVLGLEAIAYELITRIARTWRATQGAYPPLYTHARLSGMGAACASALARGMDPDGLFNTIGVATTLINAGPRTHLMQGAMVRNVWPSAGAWNGMMSAEWVACGIAGLTTSHADVLGDVLGFTADPDRMTSGLGDDWAILHGYSRIYACHQFAGAVVECLLELRELLREAGVAPHAVDEITVEAHPDSLGLQERSPSTTLAARFSLPHLAAAVWLLGHADPAAFSAGTIADPAIAGLRRKVRIVPFDMRSADGHRWPGAVTVTGAGRAWRVMRLEASGGHGAPHPVSAVLDKIDRLTAPAYPAFARRLRRLAALDPALLQMGCRAFIDCLRQDHDM